MLLPVTQADRPEGLRAGYWLRDTTRFEFDLPVVERGNRVCFDAAGKPWFTNRNSQIVRIERAEQPPSISAGEQTTEELEQRDKHESGKNRHASIRLVAM